MHLLFHEQCTYCSMNNASIVRPIVRPAFEKSLGLPARLRADASVVRVLLATKDGGGEGSCRSCGVYSHHHHTYFRNTYCLNIDDTRIILSHDFKLYNINIFRS